MHYDVCCQESPRAQHRAVRRNAGKAVNFKRRYLPMVKSQKTKDAAVTLNLSPRARAMLLRVRKSLPPIGRRDLIALRDARRIP